jgi:hypothetical protein
VLSKGGGVDPAAVAVSSRVSLGSAAANHLACIIARSSLLVLILMNPSSIRLNPDATTITETSHQGTLTIVVNVGD